MNLHHANQAEIGPDGGGRVPCLEYLDEIIRWQDSHQPRGKQAAAGMPGGIDYHCTTGIWQSVWLEPVPVMLTEVGGFLSLPAGVPVEALDRLYRFYAAHSGPDQLLAQLTDLMHGIADLPFLAGFCYTQLTDVEQEVNGLLTYDRVPKIDPAAIAALTTRLFRP